MLLDITHNDPVIRQKILELSGPAFSWIQRFKMKGIGSGKLIIEDSGEPLKELLYENTDTLYCNIELRTKGVVAGFMTGRRVYGWVIPYDQLVVIQNQDQLTVTGPDMFMKLKAPFNQSINVKFLEKLTKLQNKIRAN
ncbi:MAG: hypothetical protein HKN67_11025 [Saprospiraceae bacterium]|nr:hypothetical protein [Bacteroidia bacterium]NNF22467.1 hypothetical protein [Saprospiraceae bacterium]